MVSALPDARLAYSRRNMAEKSRSERNIQLKGPEGRSLPILPLRETVLFPHAVLPLAVGRESSVQLVNSLGEDKTNAKPVLRRLRRAISTQWELWRLFTESSKCPTRCYWFVPKAWNACGWRSLAS